MCLDSFAIGLLGELFLDLILKGVLSLFRRGERRGDRDLDQALGRESTDLVFEFSSERFSLFLEF